MAMLDGVTAGGAGRSEQDSAAGGAPRCQRVCGTPGRRAPPARRQTAIIASGGGGTATSDRKLRATSTGHGALLL